MEGIILFMNIVYKKFNSFRQKIFVLVVEVLALAVILVVVLVVELVVEA